MGYMKNKQNNEFSHFFLFNDYKFNSTKSSQKTLTLTL